MSLGLQDTVSAAAVKDVYRACESLKLLTEDERDRLHLNESSFLSSESRLPESTLIHLWRLLEEDVNQAGIGLTIGQTIEPDSKGILASWVSQASTLIEALTIFIEHIPLMNPSEHWHLKENGQHCTLDFEIEDKGYPQCAIERSMAALVSWAELLSGKKLEIKEARFYFERPAYAELFTPIFGNNIHYRARENRLTFDSKDLRLPILSSNELLKSLMKEKALATLSKLSESTSVKEKVQVLIRQSLDLNQTLSIDDASKYLAQSRQTLYRQLKREGTDFQSIYDLTRKERAFQLLGSNELSHSAISLELGFKETSSFYKAFRRWTGLTPNEYLMDLHSK